MCVFFRCSQSLCFFLFKKKTYMPTCPHCNKVFAGPSGLWYHKVTHHGYQPTRRCKKTSTPHKHPKPHEHPSAPATVNDDDLLVIRTGELGICITTVRTQEISYALTLSDPEIELGVLTILDEHAMSDLSAGQHDPLRVVGVQSCVLPHLSSGIHGSTRPRRLPPV